MLIVTLELSKRRGNARVIKILLNVSKISRECIPLPLRSSPDLRLKTSLSENGMKLISRLERCYDLSSMIVFDLPSGPLIEKVIHQVDALNPRFSVSASTDTFPVGEKTMTHKQNQAIILKVLLRLLWVVSCDHSISLNELCDDKQTWKTKRKNIPTQMEAEGDFYVVHYQNSERIQKHFRISRFCEFFCCYIAQKLRAIVKRSSVAEFGKCKKKSRRVFFTALHNNEDYDGLKLRRNRNKIATSALFYGEGGE